MAGLSLWVSAFAEQAEARALSVPLTLLLLLASVAAFVRVRRSMIQYSQSIDVYRDMSESSADWFWQTDEQHRFVEFRDSAGEVGTFEGNSTLGRTRADLNLSPEDRPIIEAHMAALERRDPFRNLVYSLVRADGTVRTLRVAGKPVFSSDGRFCGYRGTTQDITEEVRARRQAEENRRLLNRALVMAGQGHWRRLDEPEPSFWLSPELIQLLRLPEAPGSIYSREDVVGRYRGVSIDQLQESVQAQWRQGDKAVFRVGFERGDGAEIVIEVQSYAETLPNGRRRADHGIVRDVTDEVVAQRLLEATNREVEERTRLLSRSMTIARMGFWRVTTPEADPIWLSQELCDLWELGVAEGHHPLAFVRIGDIDDGAYVQNRALVETWVSGIPRIVSTRYAKRTGAIIEMTVQMEAEFGADGKVTGVTGVVRDITAERTAVAALEEGRARLAITTAALERAEDIAELGHWRFDLAEGTVEGSQSARDVLGITSDGAFPLPIDLTGNVQDADRDVFVTMINDSLSQPTAAATVRYRHPVRDMRHIRFVIETEFGEDGHPTSIFGIVQDVTGQKASEAQLAARTEALNEAHEMGRMGDWSWRLGESHVRGSPQMYALMRLQIGEFEPTQANILARYVGDSRDLVLSSQAKVFRTGGVDSVDVQVLLGDGTIGDFTVTSKADRDDSGAIIGLVGTIQDISDRKRSERELEKLAFYDPLTSLANRALFQRQITRAAERAAQEKGSAALLLLDLDRFKEVNDSLGHAAGDELLLKVSQALRRVLPAEAMLARLGGDEFAVILPRAGEDEAAAHADRIVEEVAKPFPLRLGEVNIGSSVGIAMIPKDGATADELMRHGDLALYRAKDDGRGRFRFFEASFSDLAQEKSRLARDLRVAIDAGDQLQLHYQPQVRLSDGLVTGFEALLRWKHPERGFVPPSEFIPIAESSTLIYDLGVCVLRESCRQMKAWLDAGLPSRTVSVNVSAAQLWHTEFEVEVARALADTGLSPDRLVLELTESVFVSDGLPRVKQALDKLKALGVRLALDDFGTGYSSLGYLTQLPFESLKIDRCFVRGIEKDERKRELLRGVLALGRGLGMTTVAEGAEDEGEVAALKGMGCDSVQGYVFARPAPAADVIEAAARIEESTRVRRAA